MGDKLPTIITNDLHTEQGDTAYEEFRALSKEPPAWMNDSVRPPPPISATRPAPPISVPGLPSIPAVIPPLPSMPTQPPPVVTVPSVVLPAPVLPAPAIPVQPSAPPPVAPSQPGSWQTAVIGALSAVATNIANSQFKAWAESPRDIFALVLSESGGNWTAIKNEGHSKKLGRDYYSFGLFQNSELFGQDRYRNGPNMIGQGLAAKMVPFPSTATWTREAAAVPLLDNPRQLWYAMVLLRSLSKFKNTYFSKVSGQDIVGTTDKKLLPSEAERLKAQQIATLVKSQANLLGISTSGVLTKAFWLASSPQGVLNLVSKPDARLAAYATHWRSL